MGWLLEVNVITFGFNRLTLSPTTVRTDPLLEVIVTVWECPRQKGLPHASEKCVDSRGTLTARTFILQDSPATRTTVLLQHRLRQ